MLHDPGVAHPSSASRGGFIPRTAPLWALVDVVSDQIVLDSASRTRRARAWVRSGAVTAWLVVIIASGSPRWSWALPWVVTTALTVPHAYRNELKRYATGFRPFDRFVGWLLPNYSTTPSINPVGLLEAVGCLLGGLVTGQLFGSALAPVHAFDLGDAAQRAAVPAAYVLATIVLAGGAAIVTAQVTWENFEVTASRAYRRAWFVLSGGLTLLVFVLLWPGSSSVPGYGLRLTLAIGAGVLVAFTCVYGRLDAARRIKAVGALVGQVKTLVREGDSVHVHNAKRAAHEIANDLQAVGSRGAEPVRRLDAALFRLQQDMQADREFEPLSAASVYAERAATRGVRSHWRGVIADLDPNTVLPVDAEMIKVTIDALLSNAKEQKANDLTIELVASPNRPIGSRIEVSATCDCGRFFDGGMLKPTSSLRRLERRLGAIAGGLTIQDLGDGRHVTRCFWPTISYPTKL